MINTSNIDHSVNSSIQNPKFKNQNQFYNHEKQQYLQHHQKQQSNLPQIRKSVHHTRNQTNNNQLSKNAPRQHSEIERISSHQPSTPNKNKQLRKSPSFTNVVSSQQTQLVKNFIKTPSNNNQSNNHKYFAKSTQQKRGKTPNTKSRQQAQLNKKISAQQSFAYQQMNQSLDKNIIKKAQSVQSHQVNKLASANQLISPRYEDKNLQDNMHHQQKSGLISDNLQIPSAVKRVGGPDGIAGLQNMKKSLLVQNNITAGYSQPHQRASANLSNGIDIPVNYSARPKQTPSHQQSFIQQLNDQEKALYGDRSATGYLKLDLLGKGGCALVWLGQDIEKRQGMVAMKQFPKNPPKGSSSMLMMNKVDLSSYRTQLAIGSYLFQSGNFDEH